MGHKRSRGRVFELQCKSEACKNEVGQKEGLGGWRQTTVYFSKKG